MALPNPPRLDAHRHGPLSNAALRTRPRFGPTHPRTPLGDRWANREHARMLTALLPLPFLAALLTTTPTEVAFKQVSGSRPAIVGLDETGHRIADLTAGKAAASEFGTFSWSPEGTHLVYASSGVVGGDLYLVDIQGGGL